MADAILTFRRTRATMLPAPLFGEAAWEFLLELFVADAAGEHLTGHEISRRIGSVDAVASRWMMYLSSEGLIVGDGDGDLRDRLVLSATGLAKIETLLAMVATLTAQIDGALRPAA